MTYATPTSSDLGILLSDKTINEDRADLVLYQAEVLCKAVVNPLPDGADVVVLRVAARAYVTITQARQAQAAGIGAPFGAVSNMGGGVWLSRFDRSDLRRLTVGGSNAFSINMLPATYTPDPLPVWDYNSGDVGIATS